MSTLQQPQALPSLVLGVRQTRLNLIQIIMPEQGNSDFEKCRPLFGQLRQLLRRAGAFSKRSFLNCSLTHLLSFNEPATTHFPLCYSTDTPSSTSRYSLCTTPSEILSYYAYLGTNNHRHHLFSMMA